MEATALILGVIPSVSSVYIDLFYAASKRLRTAILILRKYGLTAGGLILVFGSDAVLRSEFRVLFGDDDQASAFKKATQDESTMISVAGTIVAQIAITALSLIDLSKTHWTARALFSFSLVSSLISVYYASRQHRIMGRITTASEVRAWIENKTKDHAQLWLAKRVQAWIPDSVISEGRKPAVSSILTISAPTMLLSASLNSFLAGYGVYLGLVWTNELDGNATKDESRNVFLVYIISLGACYGIYTMSVLSQRRQKGELSLRQLFDEGIQTRPHADAESLAEGSQHSHENGEAHRSSVYATNPLVGGQGDIQQILLEASDRLHHDLSVIDARLADLLQALAENRPATTL